MPLYEVRRTDAVQPGEFEFGYVLAKGTATARQRVTGAAGVKANGSNVKATKVETTNVPGAGVLLTAYYDEREQLTTFADAEDDAEREFLS
ncbi:hypothetical protein ACQEV9_15540 [Streptomyces chartreusis]|uniref:hypothetical protein n=1 Tax=Streptomyces chartreusis TaxID=1969 RepID=UPI003D8EEB27